MLGLNLPKFVFLILDWQDAINPLCIFILCMSEMTNPLFLGMCIEPGLTKQVDIRRLSDLLYRLPLSQDKARQAAFPVILMLILIKLKATYGSFM